MSDPNEYEITSDDLQEARKAASEPEASNEQTEQPTPEVQPTEGQVEQQVESSEPVVVEDELPEKFRGKSAAEIAKSAQEAERRMHEIASERAFERKRAEEYEARLREMQSQQQLVQSDPLEEIEKLWEADPKEAVKKVYQKAREGQELTRRQLEQERRAQDAAEYYSKSRVENPDFAEREVDMQEQAKRFGHLLRGELATSKETIELLYLAARGARVDDYSKAAIEKATKKQTLIKEEKRKAASETAVSKGDVISFSETEDFSSMSRKQQQEELRKMRQALK